MKAKPYPHKCSNCKKVAVSPSTQNYVTNIDHDGRSYEVRVPDLAVNVCGECGDVTTDYQADLRISDALRAAVVLLLPGEIRRLRESLGMTQKDLAAHLKIGESTLSRWETGGQLQQRAFDQLLRMYFALPAVREYCAAGTGVYPTWVPVPPGQPVGRRLDG